MTSSDRIERVLWGVRDGSIMPDRARELIADAMRSKDHSMGDDVQVMNARSIAKHQISIGNEPLGNIINDLCDRITAIGSQSIALRTVERKPFVIEGDEPLAKDEERHG